MSDQENYEHSPAKKRERDDEEEEEDIHSKRQRTTKMLPMIFRPS